VKNKDIKLDFSNLPAQLSKAGRAVGAYRVFLFFLVVASLYGYIVWRINVFSNTPASTAEQAAQTTAQPRIDPDTIAKIHSLQDNSIGVQSLFDAARQNPFQE